MAEARSPEEIRNEPASAVVDDMMHDTQKALESGARAAAELNELRRRADEAQSKLKHNPWLGMGIAIAGAILLFLAFGRSRSR